MSARARAAPLEYDDYEDPVEEPPVEVVDDSTFADHALGCEPCRKSGYALTGRGLVRLTRETAARRSVSWLGLCLEGKRLFITSWTALGLGLPEYAL